MKFTAQVRSFTFLVLVTIQSVLSISYQEFIDKNSSFSRSFEGVSPDERVEKFFKASSLNYRDIASLLKGRYSKLFEVTHLPFNTGAMHDTKLTITLILAQKVPLKDIVIGSPNFKQDYYINVFIYDSNNNMVLSGNFSKEATKRRGALGDLRYSVGDKAHLSGTVLMNVWDAFCRLIQVGNVSLSDASKKDGFELKILRPFIKPDGKTWYGSYGYLPKYTDIKEYEEAIALLRNRALTAIKQDFAGQNDIQKVINAYEPLMLSEKTLAGIAQTVFSHYIRATDPVEKKNRLSDLKTIYTNALASYRSVQTDPEIDLLKNASYKLHVSSFEKNYSAMA